ncbi:hypothetical protein AVEN_17185-1 [Araneus ventricosus]|uniref:Uncharacterized protein n=1 Tax=Araneus ventricosus TaxID=182803 RepID=A0A4Y2DUX5_ARAVE|nr:hypothetical protein AVEN_17185-1 [Araneus ventricosus]
MREPVSSFAFGRTGLKGIDQNCEMHDVNFDKLEWFEKMKSDASENFSSFIFRFSAISFRHPLSAWLKIVHPQKSRLFQCSLQKREEMRWTTSCKVPRAVAPSVSLIKFSTHSTRRVMKSDGSPAGKGDSNGRKPRPDRQKRPGDRSCLVKWSI